MTDLYEVFGAGGSLARILPAFQPRTGQAAMARAVEHAIGERRTLIAEAGTGTGKTFAYLVPALLSGKRILVSTGTRNLQDQLFHKDLPLVRKALEIPFRAALLKGRANYLCHYRLENVAGFQAGYDNQDGAYLERLLRWSKITRVGDIAEVADVPENSPLWRSITSTVDNCLGQDCPAYARCCPAAARRRAHDAELVVINHHLLWADRVLKSDGFGELLPKAEVIIVDEAHQFADSAAQFLGVSLGSRQLQDLVQDIKLELGRQSAECSGLLQHLASLGESVAALRRAFGTGRERRAWQEAAEEVGIRQGVTNLSDQLDRLGETLRPVAAGNKGLESCQHRTTELRSRLQAFSVAGQPEMVRWLEIQRRGFRLNRTPVDVAPYFAEFHRSSGATWIFTSATLSNAGGFEHFSRALGLADAVSYCTESPFDYRRQSLLYVPAGLPEPTSPHYGARVIEASIPVLEASRGRAFLLFTSYHALNMAAELLQARVDYPLFVQGDRAKAPLLELFKRSGNGILLGTASFWEGVDVPGPALSCVIIDKLPFASPGDPVLHAKIQAMKRDGQDPFRTLQLPDAVLSLKQGVGRLIRGADDRGVLMLCDPRLLNRPYGKAFLANLPPMPLTRTIEDVRAFFSGAAEDGGPGGTA